LDELISQIESNHKYIVKADEPLSFVVFKVDGHGGKTLLDLNGDFLNFQLLIEILVRMKAYKTDREDFLSMCKEKYKGNSGYLKTAEEFYTNYKPEKALWWYTQDTFIYKILNKALRTQNIDVLFNFHWFINDIRQQLRRNQYPERIQVYRGQCMSNNELTSYKNSIGQFISTHTFFSTSVNKKQAISFAIESDIRLTTKSKNDPDIKRVLFEINADPQVVTSNNKPFADITSHSYFPKEKEVLFMVGSIFRLDSIQLNGLNEQGQTLAVIRMTLCGEQQYELHELYRSMREDYGNQETDLRSLGTLLARMGQFDMAQKYYQKMLDQTPPKDPALGDLYHSLGCVAADKGDCDTSLDWYKKSLAIKMKTRPSDYVSICQTYNNIGLVLQKKGDISQALEYFNKAIALFQRAHDENHIYMSALYNGIGEIYKEQQQYEKALYYHKMSLSIKQKHRLPNHPDLAISYNRIGLVHHCLRHHDTALNYYNRSLEINEKVLPSMHIEIANTYMNIGLLYGDKGNLETALNYLKSAKKIYRHLLPSHSLEVVRIKKAIQAVSDRFNKS